MVANHRGTSDDSPCSAVQGDALSARITHECCFQADPLREEIGFLGTILGETIRESSGEAAFETVEALRIAARDRRAGQSSADVEIKRLVAAMDEEQLTVAIRAFTVFLDLLNMVEDRRRIRVLDRRAREAFPIRVESRFAMRFKHFAKPESRLRRWNA